MMDDDEVKSALWWFHNLTLGEREQILVRIYRGRAENE